MLILAFVTGVAVGVFIMALIEEYETRPRGHSNQ